MTESIQTIFKPERVTNDFTGYDYPNKVRLVVLDRYADGVASVSEIVEADTLTIALNAVIERGHVPTHVQTGHATPVKIIPNDVHAEVAKALPELRKQPVEDLTPLYSVGEAAMRCLQSSDKPDARAFAGAGPYCRSIEVENADNREDEFWTFIIDTAENTLHAYCHYDGEDLAFMATETGTWDRIN